MSDKETIDRLMNSVFLSGDLKERQQTYSDIVAKYYGDPEFKARVDADPTSALKSEGFDVPEGASVRLAFNTPELLHIVLPAPSTFKK